MRPATGRSGASRQPYSEMPDASSFRCPRGSAGRTPRGRGQPDLHNPHRDAERAMFDDPQRMPASGAPRVADVPSRPITHPMRLQTGFRRVPHPLCDTIELAVLLPCLIVSPQPVCRPLMKRNSGIVGQYDPPTPQSKASGRILRGLREHLHRACRVACSGRRDRGQAIVGCPATRSLDRRAFA